MTTVADPLSAGLMMMSERARNCLRACHSFGRRLSFRLVDLVSRHMHRFLPLSGRFQWLHLCSLGVSMCFFLPEFSIFLVVFFIVTGFRVIEELPQSDSASEIFQVLFQLEAVCSWWFRSKLESFGQCEMS